MARVCAPAAPLVVSVVISSLIWTAEGRPQTSPAAAGPSAQPQPASAHLAPVESGSAEAGSGVVFGIGIALAVLGAAAIPVGVVIVADADTTCDPDRVIVWGRKIECDTHLEVPVFGVVLATHGLGALVTGIALAVIHAPASTSTPTTSWQLTVGPAGAVATWKF